MINFTTLMTKFLIFSFIIWICGYYAICAALWRIAELITDGSVLKKHVLYACKRQKKAIKLCLDGSALYCSVGLTEKNRARIRLFC